MKRLITAKEMQELLDLRDWNHRQLAQELEMSDSSVTRWLNGERVPHVYVQKVMRKMLDDARRKAAHQKV